jgi:peptidoglycan/LPS O-acetylase OafA/YrhL
MLDASGGRIAALDGWRGIAILLVLLEHFKVSMRPAFLARWTNTGTHGVALFFVLSGFLITRNLIESPDLRSFFIRRFFRLMPAAWVYLIFARFVDAHVSVFEIIASVFSYRNYSLGSWTTGHFWSLSIEEQFYLVWPFLLLVLGLRKAQWLVMALAASAAVYRFLNWGYFDGRRNQLTYLHVDAICVGCLLALVLNAHGELLEGFFRVAWLPALAGACFCVWYFDRFLIPLVECLAFAVLIGHSAITRLRIMEFKPLAWFGVISYSLYLWQQIFLVPERTILALALAVIPVACVSYYCIERPMRRLGVRIASRRIITAQLPTEVSVSLSS